MCDQQSLRSACAYAQTDQIHCMSLEYSMDFKLLTEHYLEFLSLKGGFTGLSESMLVKMPHCWKSHVTAQLSKHATSEFSIFYIVCVAKQASLDMALSETPRICILLTRSKTR